MSTTLEVKNVTKRFGQLAAVNNLSFEVDKEIFGIAGPNGAGKTTLFNVISGYFSASGEIYFLGEKIDGLRPFQVCQKGIARTFQIPSVFSTLSVYDNIRVGAHFGNRDQDEKKNIKDVLQFVGLTEKQNTISMNLSLFDKKLTMLAASLATHPKLLMLDEPIGGLSPWEIKQSIDLFKRINRELGVTLIVIEHLMKFLMEISNRMMILHNGQKICIGVPGEVATNKQVIDVYLGVNYA
jgi:branched-chain amino acid transport system ATP-binding protein